MSALRICWRARRATIGTHLALTGERIGAADAIYCRARRCSHPGRETLADLPSVLADCRTAQDVRTRLSRMSSPPAAGKLAAARPWIEACYGADDVEEILQSASGARRRRSDAHSARDPATHVADVAQDHIAQYPLGAIIRAKSSRASSRITASRLRASPGMISSKVSAPPSSTRTAIRSGAGQA